VKAQVEGVEMFLSELNYVHLLAEREAVITRELELRRRLQERLDEQRAAAPAIASLRRRRSLAEMLRMPQRTRDAVDPCPTCPSPA
jgi:hypothetical protein